MNPIYLDLHIHTSQDPKSLNMSYDIGTLLSKIRGKAEGEDFLISLTDHNTINEDAYLKLFGEIDNRLILGVELHIQGYRGQDSKAYHCHIYFNIPLIDSVQIKAINGKLDILYPKKSPEKKDPNIPTVEQIIEMFDGYDYILLPHGGQNHATFDTSIPEGVEFDTAMQRSIYYNFFDGFTSRTNEGTERTIEYLKKLGVQDFVNLITCTDNYDPSVYPASKGKETYQFIPTWMFASPSFAGLRLSLSDSSRFIYSHEKPKKWRDSIRKIKLNNEKIDIDIELTPGLNVIIGESSSGKTLLVDSLYRKTVTRDFQNSHYIDYEVESIDIDFPDNLEPYFIGQNFIASVTGNSKKINEVEIIEKIIPDNSLAVKTINKGLEDLKQYIETLFNAVEKIEKLDSEIRRIPVLSSLIVTQNTRENILEGFEKEMNSHRRDYYDEVDIRSDMEFLEKLHLRLKRNPFIEHKEALITGLLAEIAAMRDYSLIEKGIIDVVSEEKTIIDRRLKVQEGELQNRKQNFNSLIKLMGEYIQEIKSFEEVMGKITSYSIKSSSKTVTIEGCSLVVENKFELNKEIVKNELNDLLLKTSAITDISSISPESLFKGNFRANTKGTSRGNDTPSYKTIKDNLNTSFNDNNKTSYKIYSADGRDFDSLSPGLKSSIILDLVLNFENDTAPLIIDQPEDNLATSYINDGLVKSIKKMKSKKQIIFVSHNATIPMSGDAQNIILCQNNGEKIIIRSSPLEGEIGGSPVVDYIAKIADGGKPSVKKRFKKYNLKKFKE